MDVLTTEINTQRLDMALKLFPQRLKEELGDGMDHITRKFLGIFRQQRLQGPPGVRGRPHGIFTHFYRASLVSKDIEGMGMVVFSDSKVAKLQEEGGKVSNPGGGKLAVPFHRGKRNLASGYLRQWQDRHYLRRVLGEHRLASGGIPHRRMDGRLARRLAGEASGRVEE